MQIKIRLSLSTLQIKKSRLITTSPWANESLWVSHQENKRSSVESRWATRLFGEPFLYLKTRICKLGWNQISTSYWQSHTVQKRGIYQKQTLTNNEPCSVRTKEECLILPNREQTKFCDIVQSTSKLKWNWADHVLRRNGNRWTTRITHLSPQVSDAGKMTSTNWKTEHWR